MAERLLLQHLQRRAALVSTRATGEQLRQLSTAVVPAASLFAQLSLWIWARRAEVAGLTWDKLRIVGDEYHFDIIGKWGIRKWARIPPRLYEELIKRKTNSPYVFGGFPLQLRRHFKQTRPGMEKAVNRHYSPEALGWWFNGKLEAWAKATGRPHASHHSFRKTALQFARIGEDRNEAVALDARISRSVMVRNYVDDSDDVMRLRSNRTFYRLVAGLTPEVAQRYGYQPDSDALGVEVRLYAAASVRDWQAVEDLARQLKASKQSA
jgi:integrase